MRKKRKQPLLFSGFGPSMAKRMGWSRRRLKKENVRANHRVHMYSKEVRSKHRVWIWAGQAMVKHGEVFWAVRAMHHRRKAALKRSAGR